MRNERRRDPESIVIAVCGAAAVALILGVIAMNARCESSPERELTRVSRERDLLLRSLYVRYQPTTMSAAIRDGTMSVLSRCESGLSLPLCELLRETAVHGVEEVDRRIFAWMIREHAEGGKIPLLTNDMTAFFLDERLAPSIVDFARLDRRAEQLRETLYPDTSPEWGWNDVLPFVIAVMKGN
ncbi:MAG: hypothetical protein IT350_07945 [Deltaproteobacteria bacterium]|nr:hypothetical protein [Deltaproteobacteria bacterium]